MINLVKIYQQLVLFYLHSSLDYSYSKKLSSFDSNNIKLIFCKLNLIINKEKLSLIKQFQQQKKVPKKYFIIKFYHEFYQNFMFLITILVEDILYLIIPYLHMKVVLLVMMVLALAVADSCGGNCPSGKCPTCYCGTSKRMEDIGAWCAKYSWNQACCKCIVSHESGGNANALNYNSNSSTDVGLWQINTVNWSSCSGGSAPCDPNTNLQCAIKVYGWGGNTWKLWSTHTACGC